jgi:hypothetical protein
MHTVMVIKSNIISYVHREMMYTRFQPEVLHRKRIFRTPRRRWKDNIKMDIRKEYECVDGIKLAQYRMQWRAFANIQVT